MKVATTELQEALIDRICALIRQDDLAPGARINEKKMAERLNVSRTPVRTAMEILAERGVVRRQPQRGFELIQPPKADLALKQSSQNKDDLLFKIARDRDTGALSDEFSETELMEMYDATRQEVRNALDQLAEYEMVQRKPGYGWRFLTVWNDDIRRESYRFRIILEPAAILEPGFALSDDWVNEMRAQHEASLADSWVDASSVAFFEMNAAFHEGIAKASGNRFALEAMRRQNKLRRLANYNWQHGFDFVTANYREHMAILDYLLRNDFEMAALLMRRHLETALRYDPNLQL